MKISVCAPSYHRFVVETKEYYSGVRVYVSPEEYADYKASNPDLKIIKCAKGVQGNLCRIRNYMLKKEFERGMDVVLLIDDDLSGIYFWENRKRHKVEEEDLIPFLEKYSILAKDLGVCFWGLNLNPDKQNYREYTPFSLLSPVLGPF